MKSICPTLFNPLAIFVGSQVDEHFVEHLFEKYAKDIPSKYLPQLLNNCVNFSHLDDMNLDEHHAIAVRLILDLMREDLHSLISFSSESGSTFFKHSWPNEVNQRLYTINYPLVDVCNTLKTDFPVPLEYNSPQIQQVVPLVKRVYTYQFLNENQASKPPPKIMESAHKLLLDEMCGFFCLLVYPGEDNTIFLKFATSFVAKHQEFFHCLPRKFSSCKRCILSRSLHEN
jgi:hypothetical protein